MGLTGIGEVSELKQQSTPLRFFKVFVSFNYSWHILGLGKTN